MGDRYCLITPRNLIPRTYCLSRVPQGARAPYYENPLWGGKLRKVPLAYRPAGPVTIGTLALAALVPAAAISLAPALSNLVQQWFAWTSLALENLLLLGLAWAGYSLAVTHCRNRRAAAAAGFIGGILLCLLWWQLGWFEGPEVLEFQGSQFPLAGMRLIQAALALLGMPFLGWWFAGESPYCEQCGRRYQQELANVLENCSPAAVLCLLRQGLMPDPERIAANPELAALPVPKGRNTTELEFSWCPDCGNGILSAKQRGKNLMLRFYSEQWHKDEIEGDRHDAVAAGGASA
jgi:hypothetical protein